MQHHRSEPSSSQTLRCMCGRLPDIFVFHLSLFFWRMSLAAAVFSLQLCVLNTQVFLSRYCNISQYKKSKSEAIINMNSEGTFLYFTRTLAHLFISCDLWIREFYPFLCKKRQFLCCKRNVILEVFDYVTAVTKADKREMPTFIGFSFVIEML